MSVPSYSDYSPMIGATLHTGANALDAIADMPAGLLVAADIETPGLFDPFTIKCITYAWTDPRDGGVHGVLLDPARNDVHLGAAQHVINSASELVLHNASFDVPGMIAARLMTIGDVNKIHDTLVYARMAWTDTLAKKNLEALAGKLLGMDDFVGGIELAMKALGYRSRADWYLHGDIHLPTYRFGAMADTIVTLKLFPMIREACIAHLLDHPFSERGLTTRAEAEFVMDREQVVNRVMMRRNGTGLAVDREYMDRYSEEIEADVAKSELIVMNHGIEPGNGNQLVSHLQEIGELPGNWKKTKTGKLSFAKDELEKLDHPLASAHRSIAESRKILGYLEAVNARSRVTGRLHPQTGVLGASATGRMSYTEPALQQFPEKARPIITDDGQGLTSIDWSQIEPVVLANCAGDMEFLAPFEDGADLYEPIQRAAGIDRKTAKIVLLATMYGQGDAALAETIKQPLPAALQIKRQMFAAMPEMTKFMGRLSQIATTYGVVPTADGRILSIPSFKGEFASHKATNYFCQGTAYSVLADSIYRCEMAGLGDHIQLALHDELVVDTPVAPAIREIMMTPPEFMTRWCGRTPVFRTDMADMGNVWLSV